MKTNLSSQQQLKKNHIDLWCIDPIKLSESSISYLEKMLDKDERRKLQQYKNIKSQHTALVTRSISRLILSQYTKTSPSKLSFTSNQHGKPKLINNEENIRFNLSHNNELIIMAVCLEDEIGCDIENPSRKVNIEPIARRYFSKQEYSELNNLPELLKISRFFEIWTLKEAFVKATGVGISLGLDSFYFNRISTESNIEIIFNDNYALDKNHSWQFHQQQLSNQLLSICRSSKLKQKVNFLRAEQLI